MRYSTFSLSSNLGTLLFDPTKGWYTYSMGITVTILNDAGQYNISIRYINELKWIGGYESSGIDHGDIIETIVADNAGEYSVSVKKKVSGSWEPLSVPSPIDVPSLAGNPIVYVFADGRGI
ncbi:hypothetical protein ACFL0D_05900, partial [Thermoproteota archaeon]